jgi:hypothetical protein
MFDHPLSPFCRRRAVTIVPEAICLRLRRKKERISSGNVDARFQGSSTSIYSAIPLFVKNDSGIRYLQKQNLSRWAKDPINGTHLVTRAPRPEDFSSFRRTSNAVSYVKNSINRSMEKT